MSIEGIGGRKWSIVPEEKLYGDATGYHVMDGITTLATVADVKIAKLICGAPQLWAAANECILAVAKADDMRELKAMTALEEQVARCVGKMRWKDVAQA